jgi:hypothetical protein
MINIAELKLGELAEELQPICNYMNACLGDGKRIDEFERGLAEEIRALGNRLVKRYVDEVGDGNVGPTVEKNGHTLQRSEKPHTKKYHSIFGLISISRYVYYLREKQAIEYIPTDARLQLPEGEQS